MPDPLLSSLCTICHVHPHKYRCPRCFTLTCSLPCIKRHKQWAQCNGVRDPTKYMKRSDLATPKGIDHDYNYLTSIERELDHAEKNAISRGFVLEGEKKRNNYPVKGEIQLKNAIERCGVVITKAPKGMTRSKQNGTFCIKRTRRLQWTVEWVHPDGKKTLDKIWEMQRMSKAYDDHLRHLDTAPTKKRWKPSDRHKDRVAAATVVSSSLPVHDSTAREQPDGSTSTASVGKRKRKADDADVSHNAESEDPTIPTAADSGDVSAIQQPASDPPPATQPPPSANVSFYLHHPSLPSRHPVLIPLTPDAKLATSLTNRIVLEFPTIYVMPNQPDGRLPEGFVSEEDFFAAAKKELVEEVADDGGSFGRTGGIVEKGQVNDIEEGEVDEGRLLEVLGKDLKGVAGSL